MQAITLQVALLGLRSKEQFSHNTKTFKCLVIETTTNWDVKRPRSTLTIRSIGHHVSGPEKRTLNT